MTADVRSVQSCANNEVIRAMIEAPYGVPTVTNPVTPKPTSEPANTVEPKPKKKILISDLPVYGSPDELRKLHNVYVTSDEPTSRDWVLSVLHKYEGTRVNDFETPTDRNLV